MDKKESIKKPLLIISEINQLEEGRDVFDKTKSLEENFSVDYLFIPESKEMNFNLNKERIEVSEKNGSISNSSSSWQLNLILLLLFLITLKIFFGWKE